MSISMHISMHQYVRIKYALKELIGFIFLHTAPPKYLAMKIASAAAVGDIPTSNVKGILR